MNHDCGKDPEQSRPWGSAIKLPIEYENRPLEQNVCYGTITSPAGWYVGNDEYQSQIYYCPWCGEKL